MRRLVVALVASITVLAIVGGPALADSHTRDQTITGQVLSTLGLSLSQPSITEFEMTPGTNTLAAGTLTVTTNVLTTVSVGFDKTRMTEWTGSDYASEPKTLQNALVLTATGTEGLPSGTATSDAGGPLVSITDLGLLTGGEAEFSLEYTQVVDAEDEPGQYRIVVTFTASE